MKTGLIILVALVSASCAMFYQAPPTPLADAAWRGDIATVRQLVKDGADINELSGAPLLLAARGGHPIGPHQCGFEEETRPAVIAALLELGANPNQRDGRPRTPGGSSGWTSLFVALHHRQWKTAAVLLNHGADPTLKSDQEMTTMEMATTEGAPRELLDLILDKSHAGSKDPAS
jgi:ankyrin repeat protein